MVQNRTKFFILVLYFNKEYTNDEEVGSETLGKIFVQKKRLIDVGFI
jgi:hypothetical protein